MNELRELVGLVKDLPNAALWVIAAIFLYKVTIVGSIYGVARLAISKLHDWAVTRKAREIEYKEIRPMLDGMCITGQADRLVAQLHRLRGKGVGIDSEYIHAASVDWLRTAIDEKTEREQVAAGMREQGRPA